MRILVTNDDGIGAEGIIRLAAVCKEFGEVWVVAPATQSSAASHGITLHTPIDIYPEENFPVEGVRAFRCSGTPGDCVRVGGLNIMPERPDVVISGINYGFNVATDVQYSATCGAAFEAAFQGYHAIAVSEDARPCHEVTDAYLKQVIGELLPIRLGYGQIHNVNFPGIPLSECKGIQRDRTVSHGMFYHDHYDEIEKLPGGGMRFTVVGEHVDNSEEGSDFRAVMEGYVSIGIATNIS